MLTAVLVYLCAITFAVLVFLFFSGKCLRLIAGNTFIRKQELATAQQRRNAKYAGIALLAGCLLALSVGTLALFEHNQWGYSTELTAMILCSFALLVASLVLVLLRTKKQ